VAVKKKKGKRSWKTGPLHWPGSHHKGHDHAGMAERLTPLEETEDFKDTPQTDESPGAADGTIRVDNTSVPMPEHLLEEDREGSSIFRLEPVVVFVLVLMLSFIAFVAWQVTLMPEK
jgi:hypothetical protein